MIFGMPSAMLAMSLPPKPCCSRERQHRVDTGGDASRRGVRLHQHVHQMEALAEALLDQRRIEAVRIGAGEAALPLDDVVRSCWKPCSVSSAAVTPPSAACAAWMRFADPPE